MQRTEFKKPPVYTLNKRFGGGGIVIFALTLLHHIIYNLSHKVNITVFKDKKKGQCKKTELKKITAAYLELGRENVRSVT